MTTTKAKKKPSGKMVWHIRRDETGELRFVDDKPKESPKQRGGTIYATMTKKMELSKKLLEDAVGAISRSGGSVSIKRRSIVVSVEADAVETVRDTLESYGCPCDFQQE